MSSFGGRLWQGRGSLQLFRRSSLYDRRPIRSYCSTEILRRHQRILPWLMCFSDYHNPTKSLYLYTLLERKKHQIFSLPDLSHRDGDNYFGSSQGHLIYLDDDDENLHAVDPITGAHLAFPPTAALPNITCIDEKVPQVGTQVYFVFPDGNDKGDDIIYYYHKAILSPSGDTVVISHARRGWLSFARIGNNFWTNIGTRIPEFVYWDMVFHKGRLHAVDQKGNMAIFNLDRPSDKPFLSMNGPIHHWTGVPRTNVVESPGGEDLFLVHRREYDIKCRQSGYWNLTTKDFKVFVLDKTTYKWNPIETLGDVTIFVSEKCVMSLRTNEFPGLRRSCIYFHDFFNGASIELAVFNLEDGSIEQIKSDIKLGVGGSRPIWFVPTSTLS